MFHQLFQLPLVALFGWSILGFNMHDPEEQNREAIRALLRGVAAAWEKGDTTAFRKYYSSDIGTRMIEDGAQNTGIEDLIRYHAAYHHNEVAELDISINDTEIHLLNDKYTAWAIHDFDMRVKTKDEEESIASGYETFVLRRFNGKWKIVHSHSSTRRKENVPK